jgi:hypothetical protein
MAVSVPSATTTAGAISVLDVVPNSSNDTISRWTSIRAVSKPTNKASHRVASAVAAQRTIDGDSASNFVVFICVESLVSVSRAKRPDAICCFGSINRTKD